ncbi:MAG TPA: DUF1598 domain-containing protein [Pirellulales bacterium]
MFSLALWQCGDLLAQGGGTGGGGSSGGSAGGNSNGIAGILIDPQGLLSGLEVDEEGRVRKVVHADPGARLTRQRLAAAKNAMNRDLAKPNALRKISLTRLEAAVRDAIDHNRKPSDEMRFLAGLTRIRYVFFYPDSGDIVIAGPAEGWFQDLAGHMIGMQSGRPILELQDLLVALRTYGPDKSEGPVIGCSIDPTKEGLARMQQFLRELGGVTPDDADYIVEGLHTSLGLQKVRVLGVPPDTHFAQVLVEADYRMKLIGIGLERPQVKGGFSSFVDRADPGTVSRNALQRWYFVPDYECVRISDDHLAIELVGDGVKLVGEDEVVQADGRRVGRGGSSRASQAFTKSFTLKYPEIARKTPIYAQLRTMVEMAIAAAHIQREDFYGKADWPMETFGDEELLPVQTYRAPVEVDTVVTSVWKNHQLMTPVGGGVHIEPRTALEPSNLLEDKGSKVGQARESTQLDHLKPGQWWWD